MNTFYIATYGCKVNQYNSQIIQQQVSEKYSEVSDWKDASLVIINACVVTEKAEREVLSFCRRIKKESTCLLILTGCLSPGLKTFLEEQGIQHFAKDKDFKALFGFLQLDQLHSRQLILHDFGTRTRAFVKIQSGCNQFCSYCIVPFVRGAIQSRTRDDIFKEISSLVDSGYKEIVLTGTQVGLYNDPENKNYCFYSLLQDIGDTFSNSLHRIRISSIGLRFVTEQYAELVNRYPLFCNHLHVSLQSGSDSVLGRMNRNYTTEEFYNMFRILKNRIEDFQISTDIIVGFPGETEQDFINTIEFVQKIQFSRIHVFPYSRRSGTAADQFEHQLTYPVKKTRRDKLLAIENGIRYTIHKNYVGKTVQILLEGNGTGLTRNYIRVRLQDLECRCRVGCLYQVRVTHADVNCLYASLKG